MKPQRYQFFLYDDDAAVGPFELVGTATAQSSGDADLTAFTPTTLIGQAKARLVGEVAFDPASFPPRELPTCVGMPRRLDIHPVRSTPPDQGAMWYQRAVERISRREVTLNLAILPVADREQVAALWNDGEGLTFPFEFTLPEAGAIPELYVFRDEELQLTRATAGSSNINVTLLRVSPAGWTP